MSIVLQTKNLEKTFDKTIKAVQGVDLNLYKGEVLGLLGPNGAGKSTFVKMLVGINAIERMAWGLLLIIAGIIDLIFSLINGYGPIYIPWVLIIPIGLLFTNFLTQRTKFIEVQKEKIPFYKNSDLIGLILLVISVIITSVTVFYYFTIPCIGIIMAGVFIIEKIILKKTILTGKQVYIEYLTPILIFLTALVNILGYYYIQAINFTIYHGLIFGVVFGIMQVIEAYLTRRLLTSTVKIKRNQS